MVLELKCDEEGRFGFVEKYKPYAYDTGAVKIMAIATVGKEGYLSAPYVYRRGSFELAKDIDDEMGIAKYLKAKKPFYSVLGTGNVIIEMRVAFDMKKKEYIKNKSSYSIFVIDKDSLACSKEGIWTVNIRRMTSNVPELESWVDSVARKVAMYGSDREQFLKSRF